MEQLRAKPSAAAKSRAQDHTTDIVPLSERRGPVTMGLLWITMVTCFPTVLIGFTWYKAGLSLMQVIQGIAVSVAVVLAYAIPATHLGAKSGQTYSLLSRRVFGAWGSRFISTNLVWITVGWYALTAVFLAEGLRGLYHFNTPTVVLAPCLSIVMGFNNFFGFSGIANFARYLAAPVLIAWVGYTFCKAIAACPSAVLALHPHVPPAQALTLVTSFAIAFVTWGNEADYWRYSQPSKRLILAPLAVSLLIGIVLFPITGWMMAYMSGVTEWDAATRLMNQYAFNGFSIVAAVTLVVSYFAINDSALYGAVTGFENLKDLSHRLVVVILVAAAAVAATFFAVIPMRQAIDQMSVFSSVLLPCPTIIMLLEYFWFLPRFKPTYFRYKLESQTNSAHHLNQQPELERFSALDHVPSFDEIPRICAPAVVALLFGIAVGISTSGLIPYLVLLHVGIYTLQAWVASGVGYFILRTLELNRTKALQQKLEALVQADPLSTYPD